MTYKINTFTVAYHNILQNVT